MVVQGYCVHNNIENMSVVEFLNENIKNSTGCLNICHLNARSVSAHIDEISNILVSTPFHIIGVSETWLRDGIPNCLFEVHDYSLIRNDRNGRGGGVGLYIRDNLKIRIIEKSCLRAFDALFVEVKLCGGNILVGVVYNPPNATISQVVQIVEVISTLAHEYHNVIIMGDFNLNVANPSAVTRYFVEFLNSLSIKISPFSNTRLASTLDLIMVPSTNSEHIISFGQTPIPGISDHDLIFLSYRYRNPHSEVNYQYVRDFRKFNDNLFLKDSLLLNWCSIYSCPDINSKVNCFNDLFLTLFNKHVPIRRKVSKNLSIPWFNEIIKGSIYKRDRALLVWRKSKCAADWLIYSRLRNKTTRLIRDHKRKYFFGRLNTDCDSKRIWGIIKNLGMRPSNNNVANFTADDFAKQFSNIPQNSVALPMDSANIEFRNEFNFKALTEFEVELGIMHVKSNAVGCDNMIPKLVKILLPVILPYLTHIFNYIITTCSFPESWKTAIITPIPKVTSPSDISDFRPISMLPYLSKVFELLLCNNIKEYLNEFKLLDQFQSGFRRHHSTSTALTKVYFDLLESMNRSHISVLALLDFSKAFDCINHTLLAQKLRLYFKFSVYSTRLIVSYLANRWQIVKSGNKFSSPMPVLSGVPQGSVLGPLLFSLYINDLPEQLKYSRYHMYADDVQLYISGPPSSVNDICQNLNVDLLMISSWAKSNGLCLNAKKSQILPIYKRKIDLNLLPFEIDGVKLEVSDVVRNLGVFFNRTLTWSAHVNEVCKKVNFALYSLKKLSNITPISTRLLFVRSLIMPIFTYGDIFIYNADSQSKYRLKLAFNSCIRYIHGLRKFDHVSDFQDTLLGVPFMVYLQVRVLCFIFKILHVKHPSYLYSLLTFSSSPRVFRITSLSTRFATNQFASSIFVNGLSRFNSLPEQIKKSKSVNHFRKACTEFYSI